MLRSFLKTLGVFAITLSLALGVLGNTVAAFAASPTSSYTSQSGADSVNVYVSRSSMSTFNPAEEWLEKHVGLTCTPFGLTSQRAHLINNSVATYICATDLHFDRDAGLFRPPFN
jgi:ABC-type transport system substrate-binding protein